jgi:VanZ family protein
VIFLGSTDLMPAEHTSRFIVPFLRWLKPEISPKTLALIQFVVRKCARLSEYAILALLLFRAVICGTTLKWSKLACVFVATTDEFHQSFVELRSASVRDVVVDRRERFLESLLARLWQNAVLKKLDGNPRRSSMRDYDFADSKASCLPLSSK